MSKSPDTNKMKMIINKNIKNRKKDYSQSTKNKIKKLVVRTLGLIFSLISTFDFSILEIYDSFGYL